MSIGRCEGFCGRVDHHLVDGLCPECLERSTTIGGSGEPQEEVEMACNDTRTAQVLDMITPQDMCPVVFKKNSYAFGNNAL